MPDILDLGLPDAGEVLTLQRAAFAQDCAVNYPGYTLPVTQTLDDLRAEMARDGAVTLGIRDHGRLVAAVRLRPVPPDGVYMGRLCVAPDRERERLGARMLAAALDAAATRFPGAARVVLTVEGDNDHLTAWYRRRGFSVVAAGTADSPWEWHLSRPIQ